MNKLVLVVSLISIGHFVWCQPDGIDRQLIFPLSSGMVLSASNGIVSIDAQYPCNILGPCNNRQPQSQPQLQPYYNQQMRDYNLYSPYPYMGQRGQLSDDRRAFPTINDDEVPSQYV